MWNGEEFPTGRLRWKKIGGFRNKRMLLQQEWKIVTIDHQVRYEWRKLDVVSEETPDSTDGAA